MTKWLLSPCAYGRKKFDRQHRLKCLSCLTVEVHRSGKLMFFDKAENTTFAFKSLQSNTGSFKCHVCSRLAEKLISMAVHSETHASWRHSEERWYQCPERPNSFAYQSDRIKHMSYSHWRKGTRLWSIRMLLYLFLFLAKKLQWWTPSQMVTFRYDVNETHIIFFHSCPDVIVFYLNLGGNTYITASSGRTL